MALTHLFVLVGLAGARVDVGRNQRAGVALVVLGKERMSHGHLYTDAAGRLQLHHLGKKVDSLGALLELAAEFDQIFVAVDTPLREGNFHLRQLADALPQAVVAGRTKALEDLEDLADLALTVEQRLPMGQLVQNAADRPHVNTGRVHFATEQDLGRTVPERDNLMCIALEWKAERTSQAEVSYLDFSLALVDQQVGRLQVTVHDAALVAVQKARKDLPDDRASLRNSHRLAAAVEVLLHIEVEKLEYEVELVFAMNDVNEVDDVYVAQLTQQGDFANRGAGNAFIGVLNFDFLNCYRLQMIRNENLKFILQNAKTVEAVTYLVEFEVNCFIDDAVGALANFFTQLEALAARLLESGLLLHALLLGLGGLASLLRVNVLVYGGILLCLVSSIVAPSQVAAGGLARHAYVLVDLDLRLVLCLHA